MNEKIWCPLCGKWSDHGSAQCPSTSSAQAHVQNREGHKLVGSSDLLPVCKNCRHWNWWPGFEDRNSLFKERPCALSVEGDSESDSDDRAIVLNGIDSFMVTGPNFGCIHFSSPNDRNEPRHE